MINRKIGAVTEILLTLSLVCAGCKRPVSVVQSKAVDAISFVQISPLLQLPPGRTVHCVVSSREAVLYVSETDDGQDVALVQPPSGIPRATGLSSANILAALGESVGGSGTIQSLLLGENDVAWFYFLGGKGKRIDACVGRFDLTSEKLDVFADTTALRSASAMGDALGLARGTLLPGKAGPRLLLRHSDRWIILTCQPGAAASLTGGRETALLDGQPLPLNQEHYELSGGPDDALLILDRTGGSLLRLDSAGNAKPLLSLVGLPHELSAPRPKDGSTLFFAPDSEKFEGEAFDTLHNSAPNTAYPALLTLHDGKLTALAGENLRVSGGLNANSLRLHELIPTPSGDYVAYDSASGTMVEIAGGP